jgi:hypothetical protein
VGRSLLARDGGFGLSFRRPIDERLDLLGEHVRIAAGHRLMLGLFFAAELAEQAGARFGLNVGRRGRQLRDRMGLYVMGARKRAQVSEQLLLVAGRQQRSEQDHVRNASRDGGERRILGVYDDEVGAHVLANDPLQNGCLPDVGLDDQNQRH